MSEFPLNESSVNGQEDSQSDSRPAEIGPGARLAEHRQSLGLTVEQVANQLNLAPRQIQAIEADNYAALPGVVIARGFIRAYAKLIKLDPAPLVALMPGEVTPMESIQLKQALAGSFSGSSLPTAANGGSFPKWLAGAVLLLLIVVGAAVAQWFGLLQNFPESLSANVGKGTTVLSPLANPTDGAPVTTAPETRDGKRATKDEVANPTSTAQANHSGPLNPEQAPASPGASASAPGTTAAISAPSTGNVTQPSVDNGVDAAPLPGNSGVSNKNILSVNVHEDSWIEIKSANGSILISRLMKAGSSESLSLAHPVSVTIGNAAGVDVTLRGNAVDLKQATKNNIARLNLK
jgi:cytoskeleton protein RodZ